MSKKLSSKVSENQGGAGLASVLINMNKEVKESQQKQNHAIQSSKTPLKLEYNFEFGSRKFAFAKNSLYILSDKNKFRVFLVKIVTHPYS